MCGVTPITKESNKCRLSARMGFSLSGRLIKSPSYVVGYSAMITIEAMAEMAERHARTLMIGKKTEVIPQWMLVNEDDGEIQIVATPWENDRQKRLVVEAMRQSMRNTGVSAYSLLVEAWFAVIPMSESTPREYKGPPPSERADRREGVVITAANRQGQTIHRHFETIRDAAGNCIELRNMIGPEDRITGLFDNLLDDRKPS